ncbi:TIGR01244 family sulfur transferase [Qipengyuania sediminis]|uniref:TIGR01244 family sulfur transferase n=1 Tax=Qipengyuania sediminis TaxID=1532023 RepID=UPI0010597F13|nr:TIGR01244 family sulfur transferase [Qipengyuania sediminis]
MNIARLTNAASVSPQISPEDVVGAKTSGFTMIICNRPDGEDAGQPCAAEIAAEAAASGLAFRHIPVVGGISAEAVAAMAEALASAKGPVLAYCRSGTRSTLLWAVAEASRGGDPETLAQAAAAAGYDVGPVRPAMDAFAAR